MDSREKFGLLLVKFYQKSNQTFDDLDEEIYMGGIAPIGMDRALESLMKIARLKGLNRIPSVGDILEAAGVSEPDDEDESVAIMGRIVRAIAEIGGYRPDAARAFIGGAGWEAIQRIGGWEDLCMAEIDQMGILRAQLRDMITAVKRMDSVGRLNEATGLSPSIQEALKIASQGLKSLN